MQIHATGRGTPWRHSSHPVSHSPPAEPLQSAPWPRTPQAHRLVVAIPYTSSPMQRAGLGLGHTGRCSHTQDRTALCAQRNLQRPHGTCWHQKQSWTVLLLFATRMNWLPPRPLVQCPDQWLHNLLDEVPALRSLSHNLAREQCDLHFLEGLWPRREDAGMRARIGGSRTLALAAGHHWPPTSSPSSPSSRSVWCLGRRSENLGDGLGLPVFVPKRFITEALCGSLWSVSHRPVAFFPLVRFAHHGAWSVTPLQSRALWFVVFLGSVSFPFPGVVVCVLLLGRRARGVAFRRLVGGSLCLSLFAAGPALVPWKKIMGGALCPAPHLCETMRVRHTFTCTRCTNLRL
jgi:hypothetical protein